MTSTAAQVNNNFGAYVGVYITTQTSESNDTVITKLNNATYTYTVGQDNDGNLFVATWSVGSTTTPTFANLQSIASSTVVPYLQLQLVYNWYFQYPNGFNILLDLYDKTGNTFANVTLLINYLATLMSVTV